MLAFTLWFAIHALAAPCRFQMDRCEYQREKRSWHCVYSLHLQGRRLAYFYDPREALNRAGQLTLLKVCDEPGPSLPAPPVDPSEELEP